MSTTAIPEQRDAFGYTEAEREQMFRAVERSARFMRAHENEPNVDYDKRDDLDDLERYGEQAVEAWETAAAREAGVPRWGPI